MTDNRSEVTFATQYNSIGSAVLWQGDCLEEIHRYANNYFTLMVTSTPYPGQRGFDKSVEEYLAWWTVRLQAIIPKMHPTRGVLVQNVIFPRRDGWWDNGVFQIPFIAENLGLYQQDVIVWEKINAPPSGSHKRHERQGYEFCFVWARSENYSFTPQRKPYAAKTIGKAKTGNMRKADVFGNHAGGHSDLHPDGALQSNVWRISASGDQNRPRVKGGVFPRELVDRFILTYTEPGDVVFDPFMGSGTVLVQAIENDRLAVGIDIDPEAYDTAREWVTETVEKRKYHGKQESLLGV